MYTIKETAKLTGLPASTIRYYHKQGLLPFVERTESGYRTFSDRDLGLLELIECLKQTGMSIKDIRQFTLWLQQGDETLAQRHRMFLRQRAAVQEQISRLERALEVIDHKCQFYEDAVRAAQAESGR